MKLSTKQLKELNHLTCSHRLLRNIGQNFILDFIGNNGGLSDGQFDWDESLDAYICDQDTFDWWDALVDAYHALEDRISDLINEHDSDAVYEVIEGVDCVYLEDRAAFVHRALDDAFGAAK